MACALKVEHFTRKHHALSLVYVHEALLRELHKEVLEAERNLRAVDERQLAALREYVSHLQLVSPLADPQSQAQVVRW
jgi:hypothetical protein